MKYLRLLILSLIALATSSLAALDLPIKTVNGRPYYYYEVKAKDDLYTICQRFGLTRTDVVSNNPTVADGLRRGQILYFPVNDATEQSAVTTTGNEATHLVKKGETLYGIANTYGVTEDAILSLNPGARGVLKAGTVLVIPATSAATATTTVAETQPEAEQPTTVPSALASLPSTGTPASDTQAKPAASDTLRVTLMLPFMLNEEQPAKPAQLYTEFFKGFMLAADSLRNYGAPLVITALDTENSAERVGQLLQTAAVSDADLIIGPDDESQLNTIATVATSKGINLLNIFAVKNQAYVSNPLVLHANIPHTNMYAQVVKNFMQDFSEYTPVFLQPTQGKSDKAEFQQMLRTALTEASRPYVDVTYSNTLHTDNLEDLDRDTRYIFIPSSGTASEFNRIIGAMRAYKDHLDDVALIRLFGYPEWITFRTEATEKMHYMNTTIYSRFFNDSASSRSTDLATRFQSRYGSPMLNAIPVQGILGFDTAMYVIKALNNNLRDDNAEFDTAYDGIQCDYRFVKTEAGEGRINTSLYFITFRPSGYVDKRSL
jgi:LysM repeat protein